jgi:hypothetical protein
VPWVVLRSTWWVHHALLAAGCVHSCRPYCSAHAVLMLMSIHTRVAGCPVLPAITSTGQGIPSVCEVAREATRCRPQPPAADV